MLIFRLNLVRERVRAFSRFSTKIRRRRERKQIVPNFTQRTEFNIYIYFFFLMEKLQSVCWWSIISPWTMDHGPVYAKPIVMMVEERKIIHWAVSQRNIVRLNPLSCSCDALWRHKCKRSSAIMPFCNQQLPNERDATFVYFLCRLTGCERRIH